MFLNQALPHFILADSGLADNASLSIIKHNSATSIPIALLLKGYQGGNLPPIGCFYCPISKLLTN